MFINHILYFYLVLGLKMKRNVIISTLWFFLACFCMAFALYQNRNISNAVHIFQLNQLLQEDYENEAVKFTISPRKNDDGSNASWDYFSIETDIDGVECKEPYVGTIYELTIENNSFDVVSEWGFSLEMGEDVFFNDGWCGTFTIHQDINGANRFYPLTSGITTAKLGDLDYVATSSCILVPLYTGDFFEYLPSEEAREMPVDAANRKTKEPAVKIIGYILYIKDKPIDYVANFSGGKVWYKLYRPLTDEHIFRGSVLLFASWLVYLLILGVSHAKTKKLLRQRERDKMIIEDSMNICINFIEAKDPNTQGHSLRVAQYSKLLAHRIGLSAQDVDDIYYIGLLHDCGKISIPLQILAKNGKLTDEEYEIMKSHSVKGYRMLKEFRTLPNIGLGAYCHHERYDGKGYPQGLQGENIPLIGRIIAVADAFDAMNSRRCYRDRLSKEVILQELENNKGKQFDPHILEAFLELLNQGQIEW